MSLPIPVRIADDDERETCTMHLPDGDLPVVAWVGICTNDSGVPAVTMSQSKADVIV